MEVVNLDSYRVRRLMQQLTPRERFGVECRVNAQLLREVAPKRNTARRRVMLAAAAFLEEAAK